MEQSARQCRSRWRPEWILSVLLAVQLWACSNSVEPWEAMNTAVPIAEAVEACESLNPTSAGACVLDALMVRDRVGFETCGAVESGLWREECWFLAAEKSNAELSVRYQACDRSGRFVRDCCYHLWQQELLALKPGSTSSSSAMRSVRELFEKHRPYALSRNPQYENRFWTWFWGSWWKHQSTGSSSLTHSCDAWEASEIRDECLAWETRGKNWSVGRSGENVDAH